MLIRRKDYPDVYTNGTSEPAGIHTFKNKEYKWNTL